MSKCRYFKHYMAEQKAHLQKAIDEDKWYLSEAAGEDVGYDQAMDNFCSKHLDAFAHDFRMRFCQHMCPGRVSCELSDHVDKLSSTKQIRRRWHDKQETAGSN